MLHQLSIPILHIYAAAKHNSDSVPKFEQVDLSGYDGLGSVLPSVESITGEEDGEVRGAASGYVSDEDESVEDIIDLRTEDDYLSDDEDYYYDEELYGDDEDLSTVFNPNDFSGYVVIKNMQFQKIMVRMMMITIMMVNTMKTIMT